LSNVSLSLCLCLAASFLCVVAAFSVEEYMVRLSAENQHHFVAHVLSSLTLLSAQRTMIEELGSPAHVQDTLRDERHMRVTGLEQITSLRN